MVVCGGARASATRCDGGASFLPVLADCCEGGGEREGGSERRALPMSAPPSRSAATRLWNGALPLESSASFARARAIDHKALSALDTVSLSKATAQAWAAFRGCLPGACRPPWYLYSALSCSGSAAGTSRRLVVATRARDVRRGQGPGRETRCAWRRQFCSLQLLAIYSIRERRRTICHLPSICRCRCAR